jgi:SAM-dependent methyltransferase
MNLTDIIQRNQNLHPWAEGEKIPWNDPAFSARMLKEHLSQSHDAASRRRTIIKKQVGWIHDFVLAGKPSHILDLGCGPGLYCAELAGLGHSCHGLDFSPASIEYAVKNSPENCSYTLGDIRAVEFPPGCDLVLFIFGEFNVFKPADARSILQKACASLRPGGRLVLEISTPDAVEQLGNQPSTWYSSKNGLFADQPHLCLMESFWDDEKTVATERFFIIDTVTGAVTRYAASTQAYEREQLEEMLSTAGFQKIDFHPSLTGENRAGQPDEFFVALAQK